MYNACQRATGFLELGLPEDALAELEDVPDAIGHSSLIQHLRVDAFFRLQRWAEAATICEPKLREEPGDPAWWIQCAYALRRAESIRRAEETLRAALEHHPDHSLIHYNLACYACVEGREEEARALFEKAAEEDIDLYLKMAKGDPDLALIRPWVTAWQSQRRDRAAPP